MNIHNELAKGLLALVILVMVAFIIWLGYLVLKSKDE